MFRTDGLDTLTESDRARLAAIGLPDTCATRATGEGAPVDAAAVRAAAVADITDPAKRVQYDAMLHRLARGGLPQFVSCSLLDDRTGWPVALVLTTLGVPKETIVADYLESSRFDGTPPPDRAYLDAAYEAVRKRYTTFGRYLVKGLGLDERTYLRLRKRLLD
jgi:protein-tyrosine phosphatase